MLVPLPKAGIYAARPRNVEIDPLTPGQKAASTYDLCAVAAITS